MKKTLLGCMMVLMVPAVSAQPAYDPPFSGHMVATLPPLAGIVQLLIPNAQPDCLLAGNGDPHHLVIAPRKVETLRKVQLLVRSSGDDGGWSGLRSVHGGTVDLWPQAHHPWLLPTDVMAVLPLLAEALSRQQWLASAEAQQRVAVVRARLQQLDDEWAQLLRPLQQRGVVMQHPAWQRLFAHYKVPVRAVLERAHHGDGATPRQLEAALALLRGTHPPLLIVEQSHANRMIDWLRQRVPNSSVVTLDALGRCGQPLDRLLEDNLQQLRQAISP